MAYIKTNTFFIRSSGIIKPDNIPPISIIGCGAVGRRVAMLAAGIGAGSFYLYDPDIVAPENVGPQGWRPDQVGKTKVAALSEDIAATRDNSCLAAVAGWSARWSFDMHPPTVGATFICVDSIDTRSAISGKIEAGYMIDCRMGAEVARVISWLPIDRLADAKYRATLFPASEAVQAPCTAKATSYGADLTAALAVNSLARWLRAAEPDRPLFVDLTADLRALAFEVQEISG